MWRRRYLRRVLEAFFATLLVITCAMWSLPPAAIASGGRLALQSPMFQPDELIAKSRVGPYVGANVYNTTGRNQTVRAPVRPGSSVSFYMRLENDGSARDTFHICGPRNSMWFVVSYFLGARRVNFKSCNYRQYLAPGATRVFRIQIDVASTAPRLAMKSLRLRAVSSHDGTARDVVYAITTVRLLSNPSHFNTPELRWRRASL
jgi:hypothetical protein